MRKVAGILVWVAACGQPRTEDYCERLDECNALVGQSVEECAEIIDEVYDVLDNDEQRDCEDQLDLCSDTESCDTLAVCAIDRCGVSLSP